MTTAQERIERQERIDRTVKTTRTYLRKATAYLHPFRADDKWPPTIEEPPPPSYHYWDLLDATLEAALDIVEKLPDDFFESSEVEDYFGLASMFGVGGEHNSSDEPLKLAEKVVAALNRRREAGKRRQRIMKLENTTGRTPEEAAMYRAKADELRGKGQGE